MLWLLLGAVISVSLCGFLAARFRGPSVSIGSKGPDDALSREDDAALFIKGFLFALLPMILGFPIALGIALTPISDGSSVIGVLMFVPAGVLALVLLASGRTSMGFGSAAAPLSLLFAWLTRAAVS